MIERSSITIIGHRGGGPGTPSHGKIENTIDSFQWAFDQGADEVESDISMTKDGVLIIFHDRNISPRWWPSARIAELNFAEIRKILPHVPTFEEVMQRFPGRTFMLEFKVYVDFNRIIPRLAAKFGGEFDRLKFHSFSLEALKEIKKTRPKTYCGYIATCLVERFEPLVSKKHIQICVENGIDEISGEVRGFRPIKIKEAKDAGLQVGLGFIDSQKAFEYCRKNDVRRLYSNNLSRLFEIIRSE